MSSYGQGIERSSAVHVASRWLWQIVDDDVRQIPRVVALRQVLLQCPPFTARPGARHFLLTKVVNFPTIIQDSSARTAVPEAS